MIYRCPNCEPMKWCERCQARLKDTPLLPLHYNRPLFPWYFASFVDGSF